MSDADDRMHQRRGEVAAGAAASEYLSLVRSMPPLDDLDAWARRDAELSRLRETAVQAQDDHRQRRAAQMEQSGFPRRALLTAQRRDVTDAEPVKRVSKWNMQARCIAVLGGGRTAKKPTGAGATTAATWLALNTTAPNPRCVVAWQLTLLGRFGSPKWDAIFGAGLLVVDELGGEVVDDHMASLIDALVNEYYSNCRPLIITTQVSREEFAARYGGRVTSRLAEAGRWFDLSECPSLRPRGEDAQPELGLGGRSA